MGMGSPMVETSVAEGYSGDDGGDDGGDGRYLGSKKDEGSDPGQVETEESDWW